MKKVNAVVYHKLLIQAQEAKIQNLEKLADAILGAVGALPEDEPVHYNYEQLKDDIYQDMWKLAMNVIKYHDIESADAGRINDRLEVFADKFLDEIESALNVGHVIAGPLESALPGETERK
jgi:hypothetical protein